MSDNSTSSGARPGTGRTSKFKSMLKRRNGQFPVILLLIVVLSIAMIYSLITSVMM